MAKKTKFKISKKDGTVEEVEGIVVNEIWGVDKRTTVYGKQVMKDGAVKPLSYSAYIITHIPTGSHLPLGTCRTQRNAVMLLQEPEFFEEPLVPAHIGKAIARFARRVGWDY